MAACPCRPRGPRGSAGNVPTGPTAFAGGVVVVRGLGGTAPRNNSVVANDFSRNKPDTFWDGSRVSATASPTTTATRASQRVCVARARVMEASLRRGFRFFRGDYLLSTIVTALRRRARPPSLLQSCRSPPKRRQHRAAARRSSRRDAWLPPAARRSRISDACLFSCRREG